MTHSSCKSRVTAVLCLVTIAVICCRQSTAGRTTSREVPSAGFPRRVLSTNGRALEAGGQTTDGAKERKTSTTQSKRRNKPFSHLVITTSTYINEEKIPKDRNNGGDNDDNDNNDSSTLYSDASDNNSSTLYNDDYQGMKSSKATDKNLERTTHKISQSKNSEQKDDDNDDDGETKGNNKSNKKDREKEEKEHKIKKHHVDRPDKDAETASQTAVLMAGHIAGIALAVTAVTVALVLVFLCCYFANRRDKNSCDHRPHHVAHNTYSLTPRRSVPVSPGETTACHSSSPDTPVNSCGGRSRLPDPPTKTSLDHATCPADTEDMYELPKEEIYEDCRDRVLVTKETRDAGVDSEPHFEYRVLQHDKNRSPAAGVVYRATGNGPFDSTLTHAYAHLVPLDTGTVTYDRLVINKERPDFEGELKACSDIPHQTVDKAVRKPIVDPEPMLNCRSDDGTDLKPSGFVVQDLADSECDTKPYGSKPRRGEYSYARPITSLSETVSGPDINTAGCQRDQADTVASRTDRSTAAGRSDIDTEADRSVRDTATVRSSTDTPRHNVHKDPHLSLAAGKVEIV